MSEFEWLDIFAGNLRSMMNEVGISQRELAYEAGLSEGAISSYVRGTKMPGVRALINIAYVLECDLDELIVVDEKIM